MGVDRSTIVRWERAATDPQPEFRPRLAATLGITTDELAKMLGREHDEQRDAQVGVREAVSGFRAMDRQQGGARLYGSVTGYLRQTIAPRLFGLVESADHGTFAAAAVEYSKLGQAELPEHDHAPAVRARLFALHARSHALTGDAARCDRMLGAAEDLLSGGVASPGSTWANGFDAGSLAVDAARCHYRLGRMVSARSWAGRAIALRAPSRTRSRAFALVIEASALLAQKRYEEAAASRRILIDTIRTLGSAPILAQVRALDVRFAAHHL